MTARQKTGEELGAQAAAGEAVARLVEHSGYPYLLQALEAKARDVQKNLMMKPVRDSTADYANELGFQRGLAYVPTMAEKVIEMGREAEKAIRARESEAQSG